MAIVTGGNKGIGFETAKALCRAGMFVIIGKCSDAFLIKLGYLEIMCWWLTSCF